jgi:hypothetical protein
MQEYQERESVMENDELIRAARKLLEDEGFAYESGMSEIFNGDIYSKWNPSETVETVATFQYEIESGEFEGITFSLYSHDNELLRELHVPAASLSTIPKLVTNT